MEVQQEEEQSRCESRTSKALLHEQESEFGDQNCGEPLLAQRLLIDFTPGEELDLDSEYNRSKCRAFWDFIRSKPELQHLMAVPETIEYGESFTSSESQPSASWSAAAPPERTAVSTLELVQKEGQMKPAFQAKMPQSQCSLGAREYPEPVIADISKLKNKPYVCACTAGCQECHRDQERGAPASDPAAADLCRNIDKWDIDHPKSMEPPAHPSNLCSARRKL